MFVKISLISFILAAVTMLTFGCAHEPIAGQLVAFAPKPTPAPLFKSRIKYVYVQTPSTESGMTTAPFERLTDEPKSLAKDVVHIFWPLLTMLGAGLVLIAGLFIEHRVLRQQLAQRAELKSQLHV